MKGESSIKQWTSKARYDCICPYCGGHSIELWTAVSGYIGWGHKCLDCRGRWSIRISNLISYIKEHEQYQREYRQTWGNRNPIVYTAIINADPAAVQSVDNG